MAQHNQPERPTGTPPPPPAALPEMPPAPPPAALPSPYAGSLPPERQGCSGCGWGVIGALGCLVVLIVPVVALLLMGTVTVDGIIKGVQNMFNAPVTISIQAVLDSIDNVSQLTTVRYNYSSMVTSERDMPDALKLLYGERQVMVAVGHVNAGIDLSQITAQNLTQDGDTLLIRLPPPQLQDCFVNEQASYIASMDTGLFSRSAPELVVEGRRFAVHNFRDRALEEGILEAVQAQTQTVIQEFVQAFNPNVAVKVTITPPDPNNPVLPDSCQ
ncbi:MAG TPA: DUF4230 domain-containing protein [Phototrophicaceae bacterium]|nr:DUF4230 domain-containing protein [Phototrophicaceae bacterium]